MFLAIQHIPRPQRPSHRQVLPVLTIVSLFVALAVAGWGRWANPLVDFGRELYVASQLADGAVLYRDIAYFNGPVSPYWNALVFKLFGSTLLTLTAVNLGLLAILCLAVYTTTRRIAARPTATAVTCALMVVFAFSQRGQLGAYNYLNPYSHESTHGALLIFVGLPMLVARRRWQWGAAGLVAGLLLLGKPEIFLAYAVASLVAIGIDALCIFRNASDLSSDDPPLPTRTQWWELTWRTGLFAMFAVLPPLLAIARLSPALGIVAAFRNALSAWYYLINSPVGRLPFYQQLMGLHAPIAFVLRMLHSAALVALVLGIAHAATWRDRRKRMLGLALGILLLLSVRGTEDPWLLHVAAFPMIAAVLLAGCVRAIWRGDCSSRTRLITIWLALGLAMMLKLGLRPTTHDYGFVLAMPLTLLMLALALQFLPTLVAQERARRFAGVLWVLLLLDLTVGAAEIFAVSSRKTLAIGDGANRFYTFTEKHWATGESIQRTLSVIEALPTGAKIAVIPEGIMLNFIAGRRTPVPYINFMPPELVMFGEDNIVAAFRRAPPDYVVVVDKHREYQVGPFGSPRYGPKMMRWLEQNYEIHTEIEGSHPRHPLPMRVLQRH